jgi:hypothetical protein
LEVIMRWVRFWIAVLAALPGVASSQEFYCQPPSTVGAIGASSAFQSEVADDVPRALAGMPFNQVRVWIAEWILDHPSQWVNPTGVRVQIYNENCPPELSPAVSYTVPWAQITTTLWFVGNSRVVYEAVVPLPEAVTIGLHTSIGFQVLNSWGQNQPWQGLEVCFDTFGCALWVDQPPDYPRWSQIFPQYDLAYCLGMATTSVPAAVAPATWGSIKAAFR